MIELSHLFLDSDTGRVSCEHWVIEEGRFPLGSETLTKTLDVDMTSLGVTRPQEP